MDKCILLEEMDLITAIIPENVQTLLSSIKAPDIADFLVTAIFTFFLESGFTPSPMQDIITTTIGFDATRVKQFQRMPDGWKDSSKQYSIVFQLAQFSEHKCRFIAVMEKRTLITNFTITSDLLHNDCKYDEIIIFTKLLKFSDFVMFWEDSPNVYYAYYKSMKQLSFLIKESVTNPIRALILNKSEIYPNPSLMGLPYEVLLKMIKYLHVKDNVSLTQACVRANDLAQDDSIWQFYCKRDKIFAPLNDGFGNVFATYKERYAHAKLSMPRPRRIPSHLLNEAVIRRMPRPHPSLVMMNYPYFYI